MKKEKKSILERIEKITFTLTIVGAISVLIIGIALNRTRMEVKELEAFLDSSENIEENYSESLSAYTGETQKIINYILNLRPGTEQEIIDFINAVEELGIRLNLDIDLQSSGEAVYNKKNPDTLGYRISFYGGTNELKDFMYELGHLPYFIRINDFSYTSPLLITEDSNANISIGIQIYINPNGSNT